MHWTDLYSIFATITDAGIVNQVSDAANVNVPTNVKGWLYSIGFLIVSGAASIFINRRNKAGNVLEDTSNNITTENLVSAREHIVSLSTRIKELEGENQALYGQIRKSNTDLILAEAEAQRAKTAAQIATEVAEGAQRSLNAARDAAQRSADAAEMIRGVVAEQSAYITKLQGLLSANNVSYPPYDAKVGSSV